MSEFWNESDFGSSREAARVGIENPREIELQPGQVLYRFTNEPHQSKAERYACGAWWFEYEYFQHIKHFALRHGYPLGYSARIHAAILYEWSEVRGYARAELTEPVKAWKGRGRQIPTKVRDPRDQKRMTPMQSVNEVYQLFIPGLAAGRHPFRGVEVHSC